MSALLDRAAASAAPKRFTGEPPSAFAPLGRRVVTTFVNPPIPARCCDWQAHIDGQEEGPIGYGATEEEAEADLQTIIEDRDEYLRDKQDDERARYGRGSGE